MAFPNTPSLPTYPIAVVGNYFCDIIFTGIPGFPALGTELYCNDVQIVPGGPLNTVIALRRLGVDVGWVGIVGDDFFSRFVLDVVQQEGVDLRLLIRREAPARRVTVALSYPEDRAFVTYIDPSPNRAELAIEALARAQFKWLHFTGLILDERLPPIMDDCRARGITISMDCQHHTETLDNPLLLETIRRLDMFMPNTCEARQLTRREHIPDMLDVLARFVPCVVIKDGPNGAFARHNGVDYHSPAIPVQALDTTGAGDVFNAGFLAAWLEGRAMAECLHWGNYCAGMSTRGQGGGTNAPHRAELAAWLASSVS